MRRLVWLAAGAAGGVYVYRKSREAAEQARSRGMVGNVQALQATATTVGGRARALRDHLVRPPESGALEPLAPLPAKPTGGPVRPRPNGA